MISRSSFYERSCETILLHSSILKHTDIGTDQCGVEILIRTGVHFTQTGKFPSSRGIAEWRNYTYGTNVSPHLGNSHQGDREEFSTSA
jgi:hypothetical protein